MKLTIVTPERQVLTEEVEAVYAAAVDGEFGVLPKHIPMVTPLKIGVLNYVKNGTKHPVAVMGGMFRTDGKEVIVLSDAAEKGTEIDRVRAEQAKERAERRLQQKNENVDHARAEKAFARALARLKIAGAS
jgi:F-type H+-transporting ATPase subunit epsilon